MEKKDQGVLENTQPLQFADQFPDVLVEAVDHGGVGRHSQILLIFLCVGQGVPGRDPATLR